MDMNTLEDSDVDTLPLPAQPVYVKPHVIMEPLFCGWLAWSHLIAPVQAAMNLAFRYLPLLQSFIATPNVHIAATKDPSLFGGPFVHLSIDDIPAIRTLIAKTRSTCGELLALADEVRSLDMHLQSVASGFSLNEVYKQVPGSLAGAVELVYDSNNHPKLRFIEEFIYSQYAGKLRADAQQVSLCVTREVDRRFFMSTPRLASQDRLILDLEFADPALDVFTQLKLYPRRLDEIKNLLGDGVARHSSIFTVHPPSRNHPEVLGGGVRIRYFGHACVLVQTPSTAILIDPMFAYEPYAAGPRACDRFTTADLPDKIDYVVLSHCHQDHCSIEMLLSIRVRIGTVIIPANNRGCIVDPSMKLILDQIGLRDVISIEHFESVVFDEGAITSAPFPGEHCDLDIYSKQSIYLEIMGRRLLFLVDSDCRDASLYRRVANRIGLTDDRKIDALFIGMECHGAPLTWLYGPLLSGSISRRDDESRRLSGSDFERARAIVDQFSCERVYVYAMGQEPWLQYIMGLEYSADSIQLLESDKLVSYCKAHGMTSSRLFGSQDIAI